MYRCRIDAKYASRVPKTPKTRARKYVKQSQSHEQNSKMKIECSQGNEIPVTKGKQMPESEIS